MSGPRNHPNLIRHHRLAHGWTQAELASRAGISRTAVSAIEAGRLVPSVAAALALARAIGTSVEKLFCPEAPGSDAVRWIGGAAIGKSRYWQAVVDGQTVTYLAEPGPMGTIAHDGVSSADGRVGSPGELAQRTLVIAGCDPAVALLEATLARQNVRLIALARSSQDALDLLRRKLIHVAGVHFGEADDGANELAVRTHCGSGYELLTVADWDEGVTVATHIELRSVSQLARDKLRWVGRAGGTAARACQDHVLRDRAAPRRIAADHRGVAAAISAGWADAGVCVRLAAEEAGLRFLPVRKERYELCFSSATADDPRVAALIRATRSTQYRRLLAELPGYWPGSAGECREVATGKRQTNS